MSICVHYYNASELKLVNFYGGSWNYLYIYGNSLWSIRIKTWFPNHGFPNKRILLFRCLKKWYPDYQPICGPKDLSLCQRDAIYLSRVPGALKGQWTGIAAHRAIHTATKSKNPKIHAVAKSRGSGPSNREDMIAEYLGDTPQNTWNQLLPEISLALNSRVSDTRGGVSSNSSLTRPPR